jgi:hypothetical protein
MQGDFRSAASADSGTAHYWQPVAWSPEREQRGVASGPAVIRCPVRGCPAAAETATQLRVLVAHVRAHYTAEAELTVLDARSEALARMRPGGWAHVTARWERTAVPRQPEPDPGPCVPPDAGTTVHPSLRYGGRPAVG